MNPLVLGVSAAAAFAGGFVVSRKSMQTISGGAGGKGWTEQDVEYLARVLIMETGLRRDETEMAGIAWVAVNRALRKVNRTIRAVVATTSWPGGGARGNSFVAAIKLDAPGQTAYHHAPVGHPNIEKARAFARAVLMGETPNPVGPRRHFVHPSGMGGRPLPRWVVSKAQGGSAEYEPLRIAGAIFA